jgi:hypothetical protein
MDRDTFDRFKTLLLGLPNWRDERSRRAFVTGALWQHPCLDDLDLGGRPADVAHDLLEACRSHDNPTSDGLPPLCALLQAVRTKVGPSPSRAADLAALEATLCAPAPTGDRAQPTGREQATTILFLAADPPTSPGCA